VLYVDRGKEARRYGCSEFIYEASADVNDRREQASTVTPARLDGLV